MRQVGSIKRQREHLGHHTGSPFEIVYRLKQRDHRQASLTFNRVIQSGLLGQQQHLQQIANTATHADDIGLAHGHAKLGLNPANNLEGGQYLLGLLGEGRGRRH